MRRPPGRRSRILEVRRCRGPDVRRGPLQAADRQDVQLTARNLEITSEDLSLHVAGRHRLPRRMRRRRHGLILLGRGVMTFLADGGRRTRTAPPVLWQRHAASPFESRVRPSEPFGLRASAWPSPRSRRRHPTPRTVPPGAKKSSREHAPKSFNVDLQDLSTGRLVPASPSRRFPRRGRHASLRHADLHAHRRRRRKTSGSSAAKTG